MRMPGYGETQPRLDDDRMPVILVTLDGSGTDPSRSCRAGPPLRRHAPPSSTD